MTAGTLQPEWDPDSAHVGLSPENFFFKLELVLVLRFSLSGPLTSRTVEIPPLGFPSVTSQCFAVRLPLDSPSSAVPFDVTRRRQPAHTDSVECRTTRWVV